MTQSLIDRMVAALHAAHAALSDPYAGEDDGKREAPVLAQIDAVLEEFSRTRARPVVPLVLSDEEAQALADLLMLVGGSPSGVRGKTDSIRSALSAAGVEGRPAHDAINNPWSGSICSKMLR